MRVAIASLGRFHVLDLARELDACGLDVAFHSYVRRARAQRFGLPRSCQRGLFPLLLPLLAWQFRAPRLLPALQERAMAHALDAAVIARLEPCEAFVCMSGMYLGAARHARERFGARIYLERGSQHIVAQRRILERLGAARRPSDFIVRRELAGYELADRISVPSTAVVESFREEAPDLAGKLFANPYGVDLDQFPLREGPPPGGPPTVLFVGGWTLRKGVDVLVEAIRRLDGVRLRHVGALGDHPFPHGDPRFEHVEPMPQWQLGAQYRAAHAVALASREEGLALVQAQALASGVPLVCTTRTGGADLALSDGLARRIAVVPPDDAAALAGAIGATLDAVAAGRMPRLDSRDRNLLSWRAYGRRYVEELTRSRRSSAATPAALPPGHLDEGQGLPSDRRASQPQHRLESAR